VKKDGTFRIPWQAVLSFKVIFKGLADVFYKSFMLRYNSFSEETGEKDFLVQREHRHWQRNISIRLSLSAIRLR